MVFELYYSILYPVHLLLALADEQVTCDPCTYSELKFNTYSK